MKNNFNDSQKLNNQTEIAINFAKTTFILAIISSFFIAILAIYKTFKPYSVFDYSIFFLLSSITAVLFSFGLKLSNKLKINLSLLIFSTVLSVYSFEIYLEFIPQQKETPKINAKQLQSDFDSRTIIEVINDLNKKGKEGYPNISPSLFTKSNGLNSNNGMIYPIGGISNVKTVYCNESGYWSIYEADEHGFNNPKGLYIKNKIDILLTGDSMAEGACVNSDESIAAVIRKSGYNILNLGRGGNGPLIELATLKEYGLPLKPRIVLWQYYENDFSNIQKELYSTILKKYMEDDSFTQNLISRQNEISTLLKNYFLENLEKQNNRKNLNNTLLIKKLINTIKLVNLRTRVDFTPKPKAEVFKNILLRANKLVSEWGGNLYFVYIPSFSERNKRYNPFKKVVLSTVNELGIPIIDLEKEVLTPHPNPLSLFPLRNTFAHYNKEGYRLMGEFIAKRLKDDGI